MPTFPILPPLPGRIALKGPGPWRPLRFLNPPFSVSAFAQSFSARSGFAWGNRVFQWFIPNARHE